MSSAEPVVRTYGNWRVSRAAGVGRFTIGQTMTLLAAAIAVVMINQIFGMGWAAGTGIIVAVLGLASAVRDKHGMNMFDRRSEKVAFRRAKRRKATSYRSGVLAASKRGDGRCRLPGILGATHVSEHEDAHRRRFAVIHHGDGRLSVAMALAPAGDGLVDQDMVDREVALWGMWLSDLSDEAGVVDASVTVETSPDTGQRLRREVTSRADATAPPIAAHIIDGVVDAAGAGGARVRTWATISFDPARMSSEKRGRTSRAVRDIATRLPGLTQNLAIGGAGAIHLMRADELARLVRVAYDPEVEPVLDQAVVDGAEITLDWADVGPVAAEATWDTYRHDSGLSRSWTVTRPPRGMVQSGVLRSLLQLSRDVERKRVTMLYRPMDAARAPEVVERDVDKATARIKASRRPTERMERDVAQARQTSQEEADGASVVDFGCVVTATVSGIDAERQLVDASAAVTSLAAGSRMLVRPAYGAQDSAFALGLPLGLTPARQTLSGGW
ncbi:SCO6880 family protein [Actinomyces faecalis]|uniref:SCO6880 family protein n=1 Tax=Actinomyces faecalis TaxID=2722820 RepID=UPI001556A1FE|nr:SCO6880 family protein [Actinomyces faecalis]